MLIIAITNYLSVVELHNFRRLSDHILKIMQFNNGIKTLITLTSHESLAVGAQNQHRALGKYSLFESETSTNCLPALPVFKRELKYLIGSTYITTPPYISRTPK